MKSILEKVKEFPKLQQTQSPSTPGLYYRESPLPQVEFWDWVWPGPELQLVWRVELKTSISNSSQI